MKRQSTEWEKIRRKYVQILSDKGITTRLYKELLEFSNEKRIIQLKISKGSQQYSKEK